MSCVQEDLKDEGIHDIQERVTIYIPGRHGRIGIIVPDHKPTIEEVTQFHRKIAEVIVNNSKSHQ